MIYHIPSPKVVPVGAFLYTVKLVPDLAKLEGLRGKCDWNRLDILIEAGDLPQIKTATLLHETLHAIDNVWLQHTLADNQVDALAGGLHQVIQGMGIEIVWPPTDCL